MTGPASLNGGWLLWLSALCFGRLGRRGLFYCLNQSHEPVRNLNCSGDSYDGPHHATQKRRTVVSRVNAAATSGRALRSAPVSILALVTAFHVILYSPA